MDVNEVDQILSDKLVGLAIRYAFHCLTLLVTHRCWVCIAFRRERFYELWLNLSQL